MWDPAGMVGWNILASGHGFTIANLDNWASIVASAPLSHMGFHAPLIPIDNADKMPDEVSDYLQLTSAHFQNTPAEGPYNMVYILGDFEDVSWQTQNMAEAYSGMTPIRNFNQDN